MLFNLAAPCLLDIHDGLVCNQGWEDPGSEFREGRLLGLMVRSSFTLLRASQVIKYDLGHWSVWCANPESVCNDSKRDLVSYKAGRSCYRIIRTGVKSLNLLVFIMIKHLKKPNSIAHVSFSVLCFIFFIFFHLFLFHFLVHLCKEMYVFLIKITVSPY